MPAINQRSNDNLEQLTQSYWQCSKDLLDRLHKNKFRHTLSDQIALADLITHPLIKRSKNLQDGILKSSEIVRQIIQNRANSKTIRPKICTRKSTPFKRGDEIILGVAKDGQTKNWRGFLGRQDMKTGQWYVMTPDWQGYASEAAIRPAPNGGDAA